MPIQTVIHTLRHAHTEYSAEKRYAGSIDIGLSDTGVKDAHRISRELSSYRFDVVITSALRRAQETAEIVVRRGVPIAQTPLCNERNFGIMEGRTWAEIQTLNPPVLLIKVGDDFHTVNPKGGESFEDVWQRAKRFRNFLFRNYLGKSILVVSHGVFLQMFHGLIRGLSCIESLAIYPAHLELHRFVFTGRRLVSEETLKLLQEERERW